MTKRTSPSAARRAARTAIQDKTTQPVDALAPKVAEQIVGYKPVRIDPVVWAAVRLTVVEIVVRSMPSSPEHAQHRMLPVARLAAWAHSAGIALDAKTLLSERVVEEWARQAVTSGEPKSSVATYRSVLRTVANAVFPPATDTTATVPRTTGAAPYSAAEDLALRRVVTGQRSAVYRTTGSLLYGLARGAGLSSTDLRSLRVTDVTDLGDAIRIDVAGRSVWVLEELCDVVRIGLSVDRPGGWLLAGRNGQRRNIGEYIDRFTVPSGTPRLNLFRCRATWILDHLNRGTPVTIVQDALGTSGLTSIERILPYAEPVADDERQRLLRGGP